MSVKAQTKLICEGYQVYFLLLVEEETRSDLTTSASGSRGVARLKKLYPACAAATLRKTPSQTPKVSSPAAHLPWLSLYFVSKETK